MHRCARCGGSCQGLRVRIAPDERDALAARAETLGIPQPFAGPWLRQNWGVCVFYADGCRLHATWGAEAKPAVCRQFPTLAHGLDPACFHVTLPEAEADWDWDDLAPGRAARATLGALPLVAVLDSPHLGPMATELLRGLDHAEPTAPPPGERAAWSGRIRAAETFAERDVLIGGAQLLIGAGRPRGAGFAAWMRLVRTGVL